MVAFKISLVILFGLVITGIAFLGIVSFRYHQASVATERWVEHAHTVVDKTEGISSSYKDLLLESNAVFVSGDTALIHQYRGARRRIISCIDELRLLTSDNQAQQKRIDSLSALVSRLMISTDSVLATSFSASFTRSKLQRRFIESTAYRSQIDGIILEIKEAEHGILLTRQKAYAANNKAFQNTFIQLIVAIIVLLGATFYSIRYNFNKRVKAEHDLRKAEDELKDALSSEKELNKMKSNFVSLASHEFRTPLTTILSSIFLLEKYATAGEKVKIDKHLSRIRSSITSITSILDDFLSISKIEEHKVVSNVERVNLKERLEGTCDKLRGLVRPGQSIVYTHTGDEFVVTDPVLVGNIVTNLVSNSIKYSPENSLIVVKSSTESGLRLLVKDNGIGIPIEDQKNLFNRFYRASNAGAVQGTGLGLNILKHYVDMLQGKIKLESEPGRGTEVEIAFDPVSPFVNDNKHLQC